MYMVSFVCGERMCDAKIHSRRTRSIVRISAGFGPSPQRRRSLSRFFSTQMCTERFITKKNNAPKRETGKLNLQFYKNELQQLNQKYTYMVF